MVGLLEELQNKWVRLKMMGQSFMYGPASDVFQKSGRKNGSKIVFLNSVK